MAEHTPIEWCDHTFNTHWGCSEISPGCHNCYAKKLAARFGYGWGDDAPKREFSEAHWNELLRWDRKAAAAGMRKRVFTNSMSDLFDKFAPAGVRERHFGFIDRTSNLDHLLLTKRVGNVARMVPQHWLTGCWPANAWLGATIVNQEEADRDIPKLLAVPARVRFLSIEPMLGPIDLHDPLIRAVNGFAPALHWVICGGESGHGARPMHPAWARSLRDQCAAADVPFLFKQWGEWAADECQGPNVWKHLEVPRARWVDGAFSMEPSNSGWPDDDDLLYKLGKKTSGRLLDGVEHNGFPEVRP